MSLITLNNGDGLGAVRGALNGMHAELYRLNSRFRRPILLHDGDSKAGEPAAAMVWAVARARLNVQYGKSVSGGSIGGTGTSATGSNLLSATRLAAMVADVGARAAAGQVVDVILTIGTNDMSGAAGAVLTAEQAIANIQKYQLQFAGAGGRYLWLMSLDPRGTTDAAACGSYNSAYKLFADRTPGVGFVDTRAVLLDPTDSNGALGGAGAGAFSAFDTAALHCSAYGNYLKSFVVERALAQLYDRRAIVGLDAADAYDATNSPRGNIVSASYQTGGATGAGRFQALGGTGSVTNNGTGSVTGTAPFGWSVAGTLTGDQSLAFAVESELPRVQAALGVPTTGFKGVSLTFSGTPSSNGSLTISRNVLFAQQSNVDVELTALVEMAGVSGLFGFAVLPINMTLTVSGVNGIVAGQGNGAPAANDQLPTLDGLYNLYANAPVASVNNSGLSLAFYWRAGVPLSGKVTMVGASLRVEGALPAATP